MDSQTLERWKRSVVHLEAATDSMTDEARFAAIQAMQDAIARGEATRDDLSLLLSQGSRDVRFTGTAVLLNHDGILFLVTARHVLFDERRAEEYGSLLGPTRGEEASAMSAALIEDQIFSIIFRVPSLDEVLNADPQSSIPAFLMNLGAGVSWLRPYTFSSPEIDLAVISLAHEARFTASLLGSGYEPITLDDVSPGPSAEGAEVFAVGYPLATTTIGNLELTDGERPWRSQMVSLPSFAFGRVAMQHPQLSFFWCDLSIYPGNSGGPVIENGKLVGIVSAQAVIPLDSDSDSDVRIPFGRIVKAEHIAPLLEEQLRRDARNAELSRPKN